MARGGSWRKKITLEEIDGRTFTSSYVTVKRSNRTKRRFLWNLGDYQELTPSFPYSLSNSMIVKERTILQAGDFLSDGVTQVPGTISTKPLRCEEGPIAQQYKTSRKEGLVGR